MALAESANGIPTLSIRGFEHVRRYWDSREQSVSAKILPGEFYVSSVDEAITTVLGSCISACIRDPQAGVGGMNHFMLPHGNSQVTDTDDDIVSASARYGSVAMEQLINVILANGGRRERLEVKVFGGGRVMSEMTDVGARNIEFVRHYLALEGLEAVAEDVGDIFPRRVVYFPATGKVKVKKLRAVRSEVISAPERDYQARVETGAVEGSIELFRDDD